MERIETPITPAPRCSHTYSVSPRRKAMFVFGGYGGTTRNYLNDLWMFDCRTKTWKELPSNGDVPSPRSRMRMVEWNNKLLIFGGWDKTNHFADMYEYDLETMSWTNNGFPQNNEFKMGQHSMSIHKNVLYIFGGYNLQSKKSTNDLLVYKIGKSQDKSNDFFPNKYERELMMKKFDLNVETIEALMA